ncbi:YoaK family protein [Streptomyces sp. NPDC006450]|uniref:YoaK family protein n=1 Tax=Streptomyces sp. NPDC006450 TaxID=3155458 RepID=UPI0033AD7108
MSPGSRTKRPPLTLLLLVLTVVTGLTEAVSLLALGPVFTAMQTGNVLFLAFGVAHAGPVPSLAPAVSLSAFALGAVCGARLEAFVEDRGRRWFVTGLSAEAVLIVAAAAAGWGLVPRFGAPGARQLLVSAILSLAMGIRNVTSLRVNLAGVPTTLVTRSLTSFLGGSTVGQDRAFGYGTAAWVRRAWSVGAMFTGGLAGALLVRTGWPVGWLLLPAAVLVLAVALVYLTQPLMHPGGEPSV